jgi:hypothetical protein
MGLLAQANPSKAKPASAIVEYPTNMREHRFQFQLQLAHEIFLPLKTTLAG